MKTLLITFVLSILAKTLMFGQHYKNMEAQNPEKITRESADHYVWGNSCDGWHFLNRDDLSVINEKVPSGAREAMHYHKISRQFFYITKGEATMITKKGKIKLKAGEGIEIAPETWHQFENESSEDVEILVISMPKSHGDKFTE